jgi:hypothetical protein
MRSCTLVLYASLAFSSACVSRVPDADTARAHPRPIAEPAPAAVPSSGDTVAVCALPAGSFSVSNENVGPFRVGVPMKDLGRQCALPRQSDYSLGGIQGPSYTFQFPGARVVAVQFGCEIMTTCPDSAPTFWEISGDSVRLPDGGKLPHTVGEIHRRYGPALLFPHRGDDSSGDEVYACRLPHFFFEVYGLPDSLSFQPIHVERTRSFDARSIGPLRVWTPATDTADRSCAVSVGLRPTSPSRTASAPFTTSATPVAGMAPSRPRADVSLLHAPR